MIELQSTTDRASLVREKMQEWMAMGAKLAWLIDPELKSVKIYGAGGSVEIRKVVDWVEGEGPVADFTLDLKTVWEPLAE